MLFQKFQVDSNSEKSDPKIPFGRSLVKQHPSRRRELSVRTPISIEKCQTILDCICPDVMATRSDALQSSRRIQCSSTLVNPFERSGYSVRTLSLIMQVVQKTFNHLDAQTLLWKLRTAKVRPSER